MNRAYNLLLLPLKGVTTKQTRWESTKLPTTSQLRTKIATDIFDNKINCESIVLYINKFEPLSKNDINRIEYEQTIYYQTNNETRKLNNNVTPKEFFSMLIKVPWAPTFHIIHINQLSEKAKKGNLFQKLTKTRFIDKNKPFTCIVFGVCHCPACDSKKPDSEFIKNNEVTTGTIKPSFTYSPRHVAHRICYNGIVTHFKAPTFSNKQRIVYYNQIMYVYMCINLSLSLHFGIVKIYRDGEISISTHPRNDNIRLRLTTIAVKCVLTEEEVQRIVVSSKISTKKKKKPIAKKKQLQQVQVLT